MLSTQSNPRNYNTEETEDFNAFGNGSGRGDISSRSREGSRRRRKKPVNKKAMLIGIIAGSVVLLAAIITVIILFVTADRSITYENNSYLVYTDEKGDYHVLVNGDEVDHSFAGDVELIPAADRSFAYILDRTDAGVRIYVLDGKKLQRTTPAPVKEAVSFALLEPGVIYLHNDAYWFFSEDAGEQMLVKNNDKAPKNFMISGDASTVVYSATDTSTLKDYVYIFADQTTSRGTVGFTPVAVSNYGDYVYGYRVNKNKSTKDLAWITPEDPESPVNVNSGVGFDDSITPVLNVKGDEILYYTANGSEITTMIYHAKKKENHIIAHGLLTPVAIDPDIAIYETFKKIYLAGVNPTSTDSPYATYFVTKEYEGDLLAKFLGKFSPDGDYFYYKNNDDALIQMDLTKDNRPRKNTNQSDIVDFVITAKGNVYTLNNQNELRFYKASSGKPTSISWDATAISLYSYSNTLFFSERESADINIWSSKEGSNQEKVKLDKIQITKIPTFSHPDSKRTYAFYQETGSQTWHLFYTKNGKSYDLLADNCTGIYLDGMKVSGN